MARNDINIGINYSEVAKGFQEIINKANEAKENLEALKNSGVKSAEAISNAEQNVITSMETLRDETARLVQEGQTEELTYNQISQAMALLLKYTKSLNVEMKNSEQWTKPVNGLNNALKQSDAAMGNFTRRVGAYSTELKKDFKMVQQELDKQGRSLRMSVNQIVRELPTLSISPEMFILAISNNIPQFIDSFERYRASLNATRAAEEAYNASTNLNTKEQIVNTGAIKANTAEQTEQTASNLSAAESQAEVAAAIKTADTQIEIYAANLKILTQAMLGFENGNLGSFHSINRLAQALGLTYGQFVDEYGVVMKNGSAIIENEADRERLTAAITKQQTALQGLIATQEKEKEAAKASANAKKGAVGGLKAFVAAIKALFNWQTLLIVGMTLLISKWKDISKFFSSLKGIEATFEKGSKSLKEWNATLKDGNKQAADNITKLIVYSRWATMVTKSEEERNIAARETVKLLKEQNIETDEATIKSGAFASKIDDVTAALVKQAQAQAMMTKITEKYKEVLDAYSDAADKEASGINFWDRALSFSSKLPTGTQESFTVEGPNFTSEEIFESRVKKAKARAEQLDKAYQEWLKKFLETFDPSDLLTNDNKNGGGKSSKESWYSKWEMAIKYRESLFQESIMKIEGMEEEALKYSDKEWWKYTAEGIEYHKNMYDEYREHYANDEKELLNIANREKQYYTDLALYVQKLETQYIHPDYTSDLRAVEEWYETEKTKYEELGLLAKHSEELDEEHRRRLWDVAKKYRDQYSTNGIYFGSVSGVSDRDRQIALAELEQWYEDEKEAFKRAGVDMTNLELEYNKKKAIINDEFRRTELDKQLEFYDAQYQLAEVERNKYHNLQQNYLAADYNQNSLGTNFKTKTRQGAAINGGHNGGNFFDNLDYNSRMLEMQQLTEQFNANAELIQSKIDTITSTEFSTLEQQENAAAQAAELRQELALSTAEYQMKMDEMVANNAKQLWDERTNAARTTFAVMGELMTNISSLCEEGTEEYKGFAAAGAAMSAIASSVDAYKSVVGIPYVGPFLAPIAAASALLAGAAQIRQIYAVQSDGSNAMNIGTNAYVGAMPSEITNAIPSVQNVTGASEQTNLNGASQNIRVYVTDKDLSNGVSSYNTRISNTSF